MLNIKKCLSLALISLVVLMQYGSNGIKNAATTTDTAPAYYTVEDFGSVQKIDMHVHLNTYDTPYIQQAIADKVQLLDIVDDRPFGLPMIEQEKIAVHQSKAYPGQVVFATTFSVKNWEAADWPQQAIAGIKKSISDGAIAVKVWKNVGMDLKDKNGKFIMIDNPRFDPILDYLAKNHIPLIAHLGEPRECWLPLDKMVLHKGYFSQHPEYHMYLHPEYPSYESQIIARDNMLQKHPGLQFIGAHLGSLEWSLDEIAKRLEKFPNMAVDLARMSELYLFAKTDWQKTHDFFIKYQDRLLYATDIQVGQTNDPATLKKRSHESRLRLWTFFVTDQSMKESAAIGEFKGIKLPR